MENFSPQVKKSLVIDYTTLSQINPRLIYVSLSGYGSSIDKKAYDVIIQGESGLASLNGIDGPMKNSPAITDAFAGLHTSFAMSSALFHRERTGMGQHIDISML